MNNLCDYCNENEATNPSGYCDECEDIEQCIECGTELDNSEYDLCYWCEDEAAEEYEDDNDL